MCHALEAERDELIHDNAELLKVATAEANECESLRAERDQMAKALRTVTEWMDGGQHTPSFGRQRTSSHPYWRMRDDIDAALARAAR